MRKLLFLFLVLAGCSNADYLTLPDVVPIIEAHNKVVKCLKQAKKTEDIGVCLNRKNQDS